MGAFGTSQRRVGLGDRGDRNSVDRLRWFRHLWFLHCEGCQTACISISSIPSTHGILGSSSGFGGGPFVLNLSSIISGELGVVSSFSLKIETKEHQ